MFTAARIVTFATLILLTAACSAPPAASPPQEVTRLIEVTRPVEVTRIVEVTRVVEKPSTIVVTATPAPEPSATAIPTVSPDTGMPGITDPHDQVQDRGGVAVLFKGARLVDWALAKVQPDIKVLASLDVMQDVTVLGAISVVVTNTTAMKINVHPGQGTVVVGSEQMELSRFLFLNDDVGGTLHPGVVKEGTILFALKRTPWEKISGGTKLVYEINAPSDETYKNLAKDPYRFEANLAPGS